MTYTGGDIRRLGERIVEKNGTVIESDLHLLQEYRKSFTEPLSETFNSLIQIKNRVDRQGIIAFRLKRIKTIINKVLRKPDMNLNRMGDIAGIRIILRTETLETLQIHFPVKCLFFFIIKYLFNVSFSL